MNIFSSIIYFAIIALMSKRTFGTIQYQLQMAKSTNFNVKNVKDILHLKWTSFSVADL